MNAYSKLRAALELATGGRPSNIAAKQEALSALAELERAAKEPVATLVGFDVESGQPVDIAWHVDCASFNSGDKLYTTPPPAPVADTREAMDVDDAMCERIYRQYSGVPARQTRAATVRDIIAIIRAELGPTLGMVTLREPTPEECEQIAHEFYGVSPENMSELCGRVMFGVVRDVMWPKGVES